MTVYTVQCIPSGSVADLYAFQFDLTFNPSVVAVVSVAEGPFLPTGGSTLFFPGAIDNVAGSITFNADTLVGAISGVSGDGILAIVQFQAIGAGLTPLSLANVALLDSNFGDINVTSQGGTANVVPEPSSFGLMAGALGLLLSMLAKRGLASTHRCHWSALGRG